MKFTQTLITAISMLLAIAISPVASASENPFTMTDSASATMQVAESGKCGDSKKEEESKCGDSKKKEEAKCGDSKKREQEAKCGSGK